MEYNIVLNEPWPGSICDILNVGKEAKKSSVVIEFRQDLIVNKQYKEKVEKDFASILCKLGTKVCESELQYATV